ncbi:hypothetical protein YC2023_045050 [Brassica napus]
MTPTQHNTANKSPLAATAGSSTHLTYWLKTSTQAKRSLRVIHGADKTGKAHLDALAEPEEQKSTTTQQHKKQQIKRYATPKHPDRVQIDSSQLLSENLNRKTIQRQSRARARRGGARDVKWAGWAGLGVSEWVSFFCWTFLVEAQIEPCPNETITK